MKIVDNKVVAETPEEEAALKAMVDGEVSGLKAKRDELLGKLKALDGLKDIDPAEFKTLKEQAAKIEEERAIKAGEFDNLKKQLLEAHGKEKAALEAKLQTLSKSLEENVLIATATQAIAAEKGAPVLLMPHVRSRTKLDDNGNPVVIDDSGNVRVDGTGKPLTITALVAEMKADVATFGRAFEGSNMSGSGSQQSSGNNNGKQTTITRTEFTQLNPAKQMEMAKAGVQITD